VRLRIIYDNGREYVGGFVDNASASGLMLEGPSFVPIGTELVLEPLDPMEEAWLDLRARVTRCYEIDRDASIARWGAPFYAIGVELIGLTAEQELAIRKSLPVIELHALEEKHAWL